MEGKCMLEDEIIKSMLIDELAALLNTYMEYRTKAVNNIKSMYEHGQIAAYDDCMLTLEAILKMYTRGDSKYDGKF